MTPAPALDLTTSLRGDSRGRGEGGSWCKGSGPCAPPMVPLHQHHGNLAVYRTNNTVRAASCYVLKMQMHGHIFTPGVKNTGCQIFVT